MILAQRCHTSPGLARERAQYYAPPMRPRLPPDLTDPYSVALHGGEPAQHPGNGVPPPLVMSATYTFANTAELEAHLDGEISREEYGRYGNPTVSVAERKLAALEGAEDAALFGSGMAALTTALFAMLRAGQHLILTGEGYRRTRQFALGTLARFGVEVSVVPPANIDAVISAIRPNTRVVVTESPTNPNLRVIDLEKLAGALRSHPSVRLLVDATFATPINQRPLAQGADLVLHSATKYLSGHNDVLAGAVLGAVDLVDPIRALRGVLGGILDPHAAWLLCRGLKTLPLRVERQNATALAVATALEQHPRVRRVHYPGLASHPDHAVATRLMRGFGAVVTFEVDASDTEVSAFVDACRVPLLAPSLGGVESLIEQPAVMSYHELSPDERRAAGIAEGLVRLSVGLEPPEVLIRDLAQALEAMGPRSLGQAE